MLALIIATIIVTIVIYIGNAPQKKEKQNKDFYTLSTSKEKQFIAKEKPKPLYKTKQIREYIMKGMFFRDLDPQKHTGNFIGYAFCENNEHDMYAVAIENKKGTHLGYTPRGNNRLNNYIDNHHNGKIMIWGHLRYTGKVDDQWIGSVYIPVGYKENELYSIEKIFKQIDETIAIEQNINTDNCIQLLNNIIEVNEKLSVLKIQNDKRYSIKPKIVHSIFLLLERQKEWQKLATLEKYPQFIALLTERQQKINLSRIEKAKKRCDNL